MKKVNLGNYSLRTPASQREPLRNRLEMAAIAIVDHNHSDVFDRVSVLNLTAIVEAVEKARKEGLQLQGLPEVPAHYHRYRDTLYYYTRYDAVNMATVAFADYLEAGILAALSAQELTNLLVAFKD